MQNSNDQAKSNAQEIYDRYAQKNSANEHAQNGSNNNSTSDAIDFYSNNSFVIASSATGIGLISYWIKVGSGGFTGFSMSQTDSFLIMGVSVATLVAAIFSFFTRKRITKVSIAISIWTAIVFFWHGNALWKLLSVFNSPEMKPDGISALFASQFGIGLPPLWRLLAA